MMATIEHTCWDDPRHDGTISEQIPCGGCMLALRNPCQWCGYGHVFPTHNPLAHIENGQPDAISENDWTDAMLNNPFLS